MNITEISKIYFNPKAELYLFTIHYEDKTEVNYADVNEIDLSKIRDTFTNTIGVNKCID